jgi:hypothetical protein
MGMADPNPIPPGIKSINLPLIRQDPPDKDLTCVVCHMSHPVEWAIEWRCHGRIIWSGLHERCRQEIKQYVQRA